MRELTIHELNHIQAGTCSTWEIAGFTFLATSVATGGIKLISTCSISQGLQVGFACGLVSMLASIGIVNFIHLLPDHSNE